MKTPEWWLEQPSYASWIATREDIAAIQADASEGMVPAAQLQPTIELLHLLRNRYSAVIHPTSVQDINTEISRLQFILVKNQLQMPYTSGTPGSRTHYTIDITAREKEACERFSNGNYLPDDPSLVDDVLRKIALLPKKVLDNPPPEGG